MGLLRKRSPPTGRQRLRDDSPPTTPAAFSYQARRSGPAPVAFTAKLAGYWLRRIGLVILLAVCVISVASVLSLSADAKLVMLATPESSILLRDKSSYQAATDKLLADSLWNRNKITVDTGQISQRLAAQFPELAHVSIGLPLLGHRPIVYVQAAEPSAILQAVNGSYVLDARGKALLSSSRLSAAAQANLPVIQDQSGLPVRLNQAVLTSANVSFIHEVAVQLAARHFTVSGMVLPANSSELDVHLGGQPYFIKFNLQNGTARQQAGTFLATAAYLQKQHVTPAQYVDVRLAGRAYYK